MQDCIGLVLCSSYRAAFVRAAFSAHLRLPADGSAGCTVNLHSSIMHSDSVCTVGFAVAALSVVYPLPSVFDAL